MKRKVVLEKCDASPTVVIKEACLSAIFLSQHCLVCSAC